MSTEKAKLRGNKARLENSWPLGAIPKEVIIEIGKQLVHRRVLIVWECALASMENYDNG